MERKRVQIDDRVHFRWRWRRRKGKVIFECDNAYLVRCGMFMFLFEYEDVEKYWVWCGDYKPSNLEDTHRNAWGIRKYTGRHSLAKINIEEDLARYHRKKRDK